MSYSIAMRFFDRSAMPQPEVLHSKRIEQERSRLRVYVEEMSSGSKQHRPPIDRSIHTNTEIRAALTEGFQGKCAYCESNLKYGEIAVCNHRPAGFAAGMEQKTDLLHYVWLAYEWDNLYLICAVCNRAKENYFPVGGERGPLNASVGELRSSEKELFLDPCYHDPSEHLQFFSDGYVKPTGATGDLTIQILNLNREALVQERRRACDLAAAAINVDANIGTTSTRLSSGRGGEVLTFEKRAPFPHPGATTLALLHAATRADLPANNLSTLLRELSADREARRRFLDVFRPGTSPSTGAEFAEIAFRPVQEPARARRRSRVFDVDRQPLSKHPIKSVHIENFKAIREIGFELPVQVEDPERTPCMIILGENAAGKSSVLEALTLALLGADETEALGKLIREDEISPRDAAHRPNPNQWDEVGSDPVKVEIAYHGIDQVTSLTGRPDGRLFGGTRETAKVLLAYGPRRFFSTTPKRRYRAPAYRVRSLFDPMATIPNPSEWLTREDVPFDAVVRAMREILMLGDEGNFIREDGIIYVQTDTGRLPLSELSVGYKSVIALATDIMRELTSHYDNLEHAQAVVVIDEIETHLHPRWKMRIVGALRQAFPRVQFIVTTHDPLCLRGMYPGEVFVLRRREEDDRVEQLEDLPDVRGMRAEQILMSEFFGLGSTDPETDAKLIKYHELVVGGATLAETETLRVEIAEQMKIGDTIQDQVVAEALIKANLDPLAPLAKFKSKPRKEMVEDLLAAIREPLDIGGGPVP